MLACSGGSKPAPGEDVRGPGRLKRQPKEPPFQRRLEGEGKDGCPCTQLRGNYEVPGAPGIVPHSSEGPPVASFCIRINLLCLPRHMSSGLTSTFTPPPSPPSSHLALFLACQLSMFSSGPQNLCSGYSFYLNAVPHILFLSLSSHSDLSSSITSEESYHKDLMSCPSVSITSPSFLAHFTLRNIIVYLWVRCLSP